MSIYICKLCDRYVDSDFEGCVEYKGDLICEDCDEKLKEESNALSFDDASKITKPVKVFYDPPGFDMYWSPGKQLTDSEKEAMEKRFIDSATFIDYEKGTISRKVVK